MHSGRFVRRGGDSASVAKLARIALTGRVEDNRAVTIPLPIVPALCSLDEQAVSSQLARYRSAGEGAEVLARSRRQLTVRLRPAVEAGLVGQLVEVERSWCPFFDLEWKPEPRELSISVSSVEHEPALEAIVYALDLPSAAQAVSSRAISSNTPT